MEPPTDISNNPVPQIPVTLEDINNNTVFKMIIKQLYKNPELSQDLLNTIHLIRWQYIGFYRNVEMEISGSTQLDNPDPSNYIPYENLTENIVSEWLNKKLNVTQYQENIINQIYIQFFPPTTNSLNLPWIV